MLNLIYAETIDDLKRAIGMTKEEICISKINLDKWDCAIIIKNHVSRKPTNFYKIFNYWQKLMRYRSIMITNKNGEKFTLILTYHP